MAQCQLLLASVLQTLAAASLNSLACSILKKNREFREFPTVALDAEVKLGPEACGARRFDVWCADQARAFHAKCPSVEFPMFQGFYIEQSMATCDDVEKYGFIEENDGLGLELTLSNKLAVGDWCKMGAHGPTFPPPRADYCYKCSVHGVVARHDGFDAVPFVDDQDEAGSEDQDADADDTSTRIVTAGAPKLLLFGGWGGTRAASARTAASLGKPAADRRWSRTAYVTGGAAPGSVPDSAAAFSRAVFSRSSSFVFRASSASTIALWGLVRSPPNDLAMSGAAPSTRSLNEANVTDAWA